ncbi:MAG TPA: baseplate J/gp47 family protein [Methanothrix sp.]|nr:baseplate J/gp47 family protein [Methanothrix sp.]HOL44822.1 baseplate J/gp47 family protein [Methanothrix sp.]HPO89475.1 baseplate J/gp47 family protein [Methanothrix sp.]
MIEVKSIERIMAELQAIQMKLHPLMRDYSPYSPNTVINEAIAIQLHILQKLIAEKEKELNVLTATGAALDALVKDRLPFGRDPGTEARGTVKFSCIVTPSRDITIPKGTQVGAYDTDGNMYLFETTQDAVLEAGMDHVYVDVVAVETGAKYNVAAGAVRLIMTPVTGIDAVVNEYAMQGGTDQEDDESLRQRYIYAPMATSRATVQLVKEHLEALTDSGGNRIVREAGVRPIGLGDVTITVDPVNGPLDDVDAICDEIRKNIAAGITACGVKTAILKPLYQAYALDDSAGGYIWVRCTEPLLNNTTLELTYTDTLGAQRTATAYITAPVPTGHCVKATLETDETLAMVVTASSYDGDGSFDVIIGLGEYPFLYTTAELVPVSVYLKVRAFSGATSSLRAQLENSIQSLLGDYRIGERLEYSDVLQAVFVDYETKKPIEGIDEVASLNVTIKDTTLYSVGQGYELEADERVIAGPVNVEMS